MNYIILFLVAIVFYRAVKILRRSFKICDTDNFIKDFESRLNYFKETKENKGVIAFAFVFGLLWSLSVMAMCVYVVFNIVSIN